MNKIKDLKPSSKIFMILGIIFICNTDLSISNNLDESFNDSSNSLNISYVDGEGVIQFNENIEVSNINLTEEELLKYLESTNTVSLDKLNAESKEFILKLRETE